MAQARFSSKSDASSKATNTLNIKLPSQSTNGSISPPLCPLMSLSTHNSSSASSPPVDRKSPSPNLTTKPLSPPKPSKSPTPFCSKPHSIKLKPCSKSKTLAQSHLTPQMSPFTPKNPIQ